VFLCILPPPPSNQHTGSEIIPTGPSNCNVRARLTALCPYTSGTEDNERISGMIDPNQCLMEAYKFNIEPAHNYAETAYFTLVTYEVWINDFDRPDE